MGVGCVVGVAERGRERGRQTERETDRQTGKQTDKEELSGQNKMYLKPQFGQRRE